jgi:formate hydrogenlyase subunit 3/multisubunit Na+/H+ antiporter MnhD subunit
MDAIAAWFLLPMSAIPPLLSAFGSEQWGKANQGEAKKLRLLLGLASASMLAIPIAAHPIAFLAAWESLAIFGSLMVASDGHSEEARQAAWTYLAAGHVGAICLLAAFAMSAAAGGGLFGEMPAGWALTGAGNACFLLFLAGFAIKAGLAPFHIWLPDAHASAPSHISAFMSGLVVKLGIFGLLRLLAWTPAPPLWWAGCLLSLGALSAVLGAANAAAQRDYKRLLAYSTVENMGIISMGLAMAFAGKSLGQTAMAALGLAGAMMHVLSHCLLKTALFLCAGSILHWTGTKDLEQLGGLAKKMPRTAMAFLFGSIGLCGLPPLCGFVGKWLILMAALEGLIQGTWIWAAAGIAALALASGTMALAFARAHGIAFLGEPRSQLANVPIGASAAAKGMRVPISALIAAAAAISAAPFALIPALQAALGQAIGTSPHLPEIAPFWTLGIATWATLIPAALLWRRINKTKIVRQPTWDCGHAATSARIQYTASGFSQMAMDFFHGILLPRKTKAKIQGPFPGPSHFSSDSPDLVMHRGIVPAFRGASKILSHFRVAQGGQLPIYLLYVVATLIILLAWTLA